MRSQLFRTISARLPALTTVLLLVAPAAAQTLPQTGADALTIPPELRQGAPTAPAATGVSKPRRSVAPQGPATRQAGTAATERTRTARPHPVDFGVVMRGGSATSRIYSPTGTSQAVQESGSAFGAGMRFGF